ncbi:MAG: S-adenosylmethionine tRNA ribosyltransferase [Bacteroidetes bacterium]|nr:MAG: S-adenosylmethionine tRNA ribosyltransferase [Bacteroidota bacterium]
MNKEPQIDMKAFHYALPPERIASYPRVRRDDSNLLIYRHGHIAKAPFRELPALLPEGSWLVFNNTRVIQARLQFRKESGARIEVFCLEPVSPAVYEEAFTVSGRCIWKCMVGNARKWKQEAIYLQLNLGGNTLRMEARKTGREGSAFLVEFRWPAGPDFGQLLDAAGSTPIPPYLNRSAEEADKHCYQTVYGSTKGSVAAPTAGLHFTHTLLDELQRRGLKREELTLHVGAGTFVPVKGREGRSHVMHAEQVLVPLSFLKNWKMKTEGLIAVGTTSVRSLESLYWLGVKLLGNQQEDSDSLLLEQWENEKLRQDVPLAESIACLIAYCEGHQLENLVFSTRIMITPGYCFRTLSGLITNFHQPGSTLLLLIAAFIGSDWKAVYDFALANDFRFLSYGDSSLLLPGPKPVSF